MALLTLLSSPSAEKQSQAAMSVGHMCRYAPALQALMAADAVPLLTTLLHSPSPAVQLQAWLGLGLGLGLRVGLGVGARLGGRAREYGDGRAQ